MDSGSADVVGGFENVLGISPFRRLVRYLLRPTFCKLEIGLRVDGKSLSNCLFICQLSRLTLAPVQDLGAETAHSENAVRNSTAKKSAPILIMLCDCT
jgi:hypothetical protein